MKKYISNRSPFLKVLIGMAVVLFVIALFGSGYKTGHWLYEMLHK